MGNSIFSTQYNGSPSNITSQSYSSLDKQLTGIVNSFIPVSTVNNVQTNLTDVNSNVGSLVSQLRGVLNPLLIVKKFLCIASKAADLIFQAAGKLIKGYPKTYPNADTAVSIIFGLVESIMTPINVIIQQISSLIALIAKGLAALTKLITKQFQLLMQDAIKQLNLGAGNINELKAKVLGYAKKALDKLGIGTC